MTERRHVELTRFGGPDELQVTSGPMPHPGPGELLIAIEAAGVNFADTMIRRGEYRKDQQLPHTPGMEAAGTVLSVGAGTSISPGTRVAAFLENGGGYADHAVVGESLVYPVEADVPAALVAASFLQGVTAWYALHRFGRLSPGELVLVSGAAGGVGGWTIQLAVDAGAAVVGLASTDDKRKHALDLGCEAVLDPADPELTQQLRRHSPRGFDVIVDGVGGPLVASMLPTMARSGRYVVVGSATQQPAVLDVRRLLPRGQAIAGFVVRNVMDADAAEPAGALREVLARAGDRRVRVDYEVMPMSRVSEAHVRLERREVSGKLVLDPTR